MNKVYPIEELELLAKWRGFLEGRAISLDVRVSSSKSRATSERPVVIDEHIEEVRVALLARQTLDRLRQQSSQGKAFAQLLEQHFVVSGEVARQRTIKAAKGPDGGLMGALRRKKLELSLQAALDAYQQVRRGEGLPALETQR